MGPTAILKWRSRPSFLSEMSHDSLQNIFQVNVWRAFLFRINRQDSEYVIVLGSLACSGTIAGCFKPNPVLSSKLALLQNVDWSLSIEKQEKCHRPISEFRAVQANEQGLATFDPLSQNKCFVYLRNERNHHSFDMSNVLKSLLTQISK
jgi:hypothetical protein